ncbi:polymorphic toxin-type HINT domain-containing protein [Sphaerisporangium dianthi]|uniref:Polymorphic toxin-type HINT domain-containing protein n=2 Tax=Sphaerisporangium dianthi TaxID=1436120 RepID=A0ABV9CF89_9ACTN
MADGTHKPIEEVQVGDFVQATDPETGQTGPRLVLDLITGDGDKSLVEITADTDGKRGDATGVVIATDGHPFWAPEFHKWLTAAELRVGTLLQTSAGTHIQITAIKKWTAAHHVRNLTVAGIHTYHVLAGDKAILVHNDAPGADPFLPEEYYRKKEKGRAPIKGAPYEMYERFYSDGTIRQVATYDRFGDRVRQYDDPAGGGRHGFGYHEFDYDARDQRHPGGGGRRSPQIDLC